MSSIDEIDLPRRFEYMSLVCSASRSESFTRPTEHQTWKSHLTPHASCVDDVIVFIRVSNYSVEGLVYWGYCLSGKSFDMSTFVKWALQRAQILVGEMFMIILQSLHRFQMHKQAYSRSNKVSLMSRSRNRSPLEVA